MAEPKVNYSNAHLAEQIEEAIKPFNAKVVSLDLKHKRTVERFVDRVEDVHDRSRKTPVKLCNK